MIYKDLSSEDIDGEIWKDIENSPDHQVSNLGRVKSFKIYKGTKERILKQNKNNKEYLQIKLSNNKKHRTKKIHRLVYEAFRKEKLNDNNVIHHINENPENNYIDNLESMTKSKHHILHNKGENNPNSTLTEKNVIQIKMLFKLGFKNIGISKIYNVNPNTISRIRTGKRWKHIIV